jgi:hypothetical protein
LCLRVLLLFVRYYSLKDKNTALKEQETRGDDWTHFSKY